MEIRTIIEEADGIDTRMVSDHIVNLLQGIKGSLKNDKDKMLDMIDEYFGKSEQRRFWMILREVLRWISL